MGAEPCVSKWVQGQTILITGGTGFLGQALLHKLLKLGCPRIYLLIRPKKNQGASERLKELLNTDAKITAILNETTVCICYGRFKSNVHGKIFLDLQESDPSIKDKVIPISIDSSVAGLALAEEDREILLNEVTSVFHEAASVKFDDELNKAILTNVRVTRDLLLLSKEIKHLQVFHYVSTAFSNFQPNKVQHIEEKIYVPKMDWRKAIEAAETVPAEIINSMTKKILEGFPNTYTFTKHLSESLVRDFEDYYPVLISRPTVVSTSWKEPRPGWVCNLNSPVAVIYGVFKGVIRVLHASWKCNTSYIHVDYVTDFTIVSSWHKAVRDGSNSTAVYNCQRFPITSYEYTGLGLSVGQTRPLTNVLWYPMYYSEPNPFLFWFAHIVLHFLPGMIIDGLLKMTGGKPRLSRINRKLYLALTQLYPFQFYEATFTTVGTESIISQLPESDKSLFCFDLPKSQTDWWMEYAFYTIKGIKTLMKEPLEPRKKDIAHVKRMYYIHVVFTSTLAFLVLWYFPYSWILQMVIMLLSVIIPDDITLLN